MLTGEELRKKLIQRLDKEKSEFATKSLHFLERPLKAGTQLLIGPNKYLVPKDAFLVVIDEAPGAYWTHPIRYELHGVETSEVTVIPEKYPLETPNLKAELVALRIPDLPHLKKEGGKDFFEVPQVDLGKKKATPSATSYDLSRPCVAHRHALFVAGMDNMVDFHNDFANMYKILIDRYGYDPANIVVVIGNGSGYPDLPVNYPGTVAGLDAALDTYASGGAHTLGADDTLFLYTFNHGDWDGTNASLSMHPTWNPYYDYQLKAKLDDIHCGNLIVAMNQCHSGGFIDDIVTTTGPSHVAIMTTCRDDQSGYPAATGAHGYFSVVLCAALNWAFPDATFPAPIPPGFPGYVAGTITTQDTNNDGMVSAEEAWHYVHDMMHANHYATINGWETPQWDETPAGASASLFWGYPSIVVEDGIPSWWESPDVYLNDPAVIPSDATSGPPHPAYWGDYYHPDTPNRIVARLHNTGCAPCRNIRVEFRVMSSGVGGETTLVGIALIEDISPGHHGFAWVDWNFPSTLIHICAMVRADCVADPALPFGTPITADDNQAQRNIDPAYGAPGYGGPEKAIDRTFIVRNELEKEAVFTIVPGKSKFKSKFIQQEIPKLADLRAISLKTKKTQEVAIRFVVSPNAKVGERLHFPVEVRRVKPNPASVGGVTFVVEVADGCLEGRIVSPGVLVGEGNVVIENIKQKGYKYSAKVGSKGTFSFKSIAPGAYRIQAEYKEGRAKGSVFVAPHTITEKTLLLEYVPRLVGGVLKDERGKVLAHSQVAVMDASTKISYLVRTDASGVFTIPGIGPGEYEITMPEKKEMPLRKATLNFISPKEMK